MPLNFADLSSPRKLVAWTAARFSESNICYGHGTDNAYDEAVYLVLGSLSIPFDADNSIFDTPLDDDKIERVVNLINERIRLRKPTAYLINEAWFSGLSFYVDERVLIPRSPIAELIEDRFSPWLIETEVKHILDIGTGSACIAIACAHAFPDALIDAVDINDNALQVADKNIKRYGLSKQITLVKSNIYENLAEQRYDLIVANPPYVGDTEFAQLPEEYKHEPSTAFCAGEEGIAIIKKLLQQSKQYLKDSAVLVVEVGNNQDTLVQACPDIPFIWLEFERGGEGVFLITEDELK